MIALKPLPHPKKTVYSHTWLKPIRNLKKKLIKLTLEKRGVNF